MYQAICWKVPRQTAAGEYVMNVMNRVVIRDKNIYLKLTELVEIG